MGIYGTVSYIVARRTREVGIRIAIGAQKRDILGLILRESTRPVIGGLLVGVCIAAGASALMRGFLYGLSTVDGPSFAGAALDKPALLRDNSGATGGHDVDPALANPLATRRASRFVHRVLAEHSQ
jgi:ABC-type antimicrobial peptide transport system permease subunit